MVGAVCVTVKPSFKSNPLAVIVPQFNVPVVVKFSSPKLIAPPISVILPSANLKFPIEEAVASKLPLEVIVPQPTVPSPDTLPLLSKV